MTRDAAGPSTLAVARYYASLLIRSQRYLPPLIGYLAVLAVLLIDPAAPAAPEYAVSAGGLLVLTSWLTIATVAAEDPVQRLVTTTHARGPARVVGGLTVAVAACAAVPLAITLVWSVLLHGFGPVAAVLPAGMAAQLAAVCAGIAVGLPCSQLLLDRVGYTVLSALAGLGVVLFVPWLPLLAPALRTLGSSDTPSPGAAVLCLGVSLAALLGSIAAVRHVVAGR